jgi:uncharacterized Zn-binding protein involved in type VI secretion
MGQPAAREGDRVRATDTHLVQTGSGTAPVPMTFEGPLLTELSRNVKINGRWAATVGSIAENTPKHLVRNSNLAEHPTDQGKVITGSSTVLVNGRRLARRGDKAETCNHPMPNRNGEIFEGSRDVSVGE